MENEIENMLNKVSYEIEKHINDGYTEEMLVPLEFDVTHWQLFKNYIKQKEERIAYLERSINRKENEILDLRNENVEVENCFCNRTDCASRIKDSKKYDSLEQKVKKQQQEFIKYLEDEIKACKAVSDLLFNSNKEIKVYKEILTKYKEIIGTDIHVGSKGGNK